MNRYARQLYATDIACNVATIQFDKTNVCYTENLYIVYGVSDSSCDWSIPSWFFFLCLNSIGILNLLDCLHHHFLNLTMMNSFA